MIISLYENCALNKGYKDVFRTTELLNQYLDTNLVKTSFDLPLNYWNLNGNIVLEYDMTNGITFGRIWNYMRITDNTWSYHIYAFIDNVELFNDTMRVTYSCDYWHTYLPRFSIRDAFLTNSKYIPFSNGNEIPYRLPLEYISNNPLYTEHTSNGDISVVCELQSYRLTEAGGKYSPKINTYVLSYKTTSGDIKYKFEIDEINSLIDNLTDVQSGVELDGIVKPRLQEFEGQAQDKWKFYKIINLYTIPSSYLTLTTGENIFNNSISSNTDRINLIGGILYLLKPNANIYNKEVFSYTIEANAFIKSYGFFTNQKPYFYNGKEKVINIRVSFDDYDFKLYLYDDNGIEDITSIFYSTTNYDYADAQSLVQQKMAKDLKVQTLENAKTTQIWGMVGNVAEVGVGVATAITTKSPKGASLVVSGATSFIQGFAQLDTLNAQISNENANKYSNSFAVKNEDFSRYNARLGFCYNKMSIYYLINNGEVNNAINNVGYKVEHYTSSLDLDVIDRTVFGDYNPIRFGYVKVTGLPSDTNAIIEDILLKGTKMWYSKDLV